MLTGIFIGEFLLSIGISIEEFFDKFVVSPHIMIVLFFGLPSIFLHYHINCYIYIKGEQTPLKHPRFEWGITVPW